MLLIMALNDFQPLYQTVYDELRARISSGSLRAGDVLTEVQLADMLSVSRTPVREAIRRLLAENLLVMPSRGQVRVYSPTPADVADVYVTRAALEGFAARLAAANAGADFCRRLEELCDRCDSQGGDVEAAAELNASFHGAILARAQNARISNLLANLHPVVTRYRHLSLGFPEHLSQSWAEHRRLAVMFNEADPDQVESHIRSHILKAGGRVVRIVQSLEPAGVMTPSMEAVLQA